MQAEPKEPPKPTAEEVPEDDAQAAGAAGAAEAAEAAEAGDVSAASAIYRILQWHGQKLFFLAPASGRFGAASLQKPATSPQQSGGSLFAQRMLHPVGEHLLIGSPKPAL